MAALVAIIGVSAGAFSVATSVATAQETAKDKPLVGLRASAGAWRLIDGENVVGVMNFGALVSIGSSEPIKDPKKGVRPEVGYFTILVKERGVFQGTFNVKDQGRSVLGVFWAEGAAGEDIASGFLDLRAIPEPNGFGASGSITFTADGAEYPVRAR